MATLKRAFNGQSLPALVLKILRGKYPPLPARYSGSMKGLVDCMLKIKPQVQHCCRVTRLYAGNSVLYVAPEPAANHVHRCQYCHHAVAINKLEHLQHVVWKYVCL